MGTTKKKAIRKTSKKLKKQKIVIVYKTDFPPEETLFPEKLKKMNEILTKAKMMDR